jgi:hypothetical protein
LGAIGAHSGGQSVTERPVFPSNWPHVDARGRRIGIIPILGHNRDKSPGETMPADAKCGLLVGVGVVLAVAVLYFQKDPSHSASPNGSSAPPAAVVKPPAPAHSSDRTKLPAKAASTTAGRGG